jgi:hypothetical protein
VKDNQLSIDLTKPPCATYLDSAVISHLQEQESKRLSLRFMNRHERRKEAAIKRKQAKYMVGPVT